MRPFAIQIEGLTKTFRSMRGRVEVLTGVDLDVEPGEFFVLLGPSGCGKSTLLNLIAGLEYPTQGRIHLGDRTVADARQGIFLDPFRRQIAMVFQSYALYPHMTVEQNIAFPLTNQKPRPSRKEIAERVRRTAERLRIGSLLDRKPAELSGGQRQRVAIGRALVREPRVLLMDEPLSNLDARLRLEMRAQLKELQRSLGITTVYVTHDQIEAMTLGDRMAVLHGGTIQQCGPPTEIYDRPANIFVARFVGSPPMNLLRGRLIASPGTGIPSRFEAPGLKLDLARLSHPSEPVSPSSALGPLPRPAHPTPVFLGIRPEHIRVLAPERGEIPPEGGEIPPERGKIRGKVRVVENLGTGFLLHVDIGKQDLLVLADCDPGEAPVGLNLDLERIHLFPDQAAERNLEAD